MAPVSLLPRIFQWLFLVLAVLFAVAAAIVAVVMLVSPSLPQGLHFGPATVDFSGQQGTVALATAGGDTNFLATAFGGNLTLTVEKAHDLVELVKRYGLPVVLLHLAVLAGLFELLRRLFRNVGRGESFTRDTIRLVQGVAALLILFSFVSGYAENLLGYHLFTYLTQHAVIAVSGTKVHFPAPHYAMFSMDGNLFFSGLLVLALSEVFRQGLALKDEHALTI